jgi:hypothetical protein
MALKLTDRLIIKDNPISPYVMLLTLQSTVANSTSAPPIKKYNPIKALKDKTVTVHLIEVVS